MRADALEKMPEPETKLKSSFHLLSLYFNPWSKIQASSEQSPSERSQDSNSVYPPQTLHMVNCVTTAFLMPRSPCWMASGLFGCQFVSVFPTLIAGGLQSAILGAILSSVYNNYLRDLTQSRGLKYHLYAHNSHSIGLSPELQIYMSNHLLDHSTWLSKGILNPSMSKTETSPPPHHLQKTLLYLQYTSPSQLVATPPFQLLRSETFILRTASSSHLPYSHCLNHCCLVTKSCLTLWVPK